MSESNNGGSLSGSRRLALKRHNAKRCPFAIRQRIVNALANGDSVRAIVRALHVSNNTVVAIRDQDWQQVAARKERIAAQAELNATLAAEQITDELQSGRKIPLNLLIPTFGVNADKLIQLRGDPALTIRHEHTHRLTDDDLLAFAIHRSKQIQATVIEPEPRPEPILELKDTNKMPVTSRTGKRATRKRPVG